MGANHSRYEEDDDYDDDLDEGEELVTDASKGADSEKDKGATGVRLYRFSVGAGKWVLADRNAKWSFTQKTAALRSSDDGADEEFYDPDGSDAAAEMEEDTWFLRVAGHVLVRVSARMSSQFLDSQQRVNFHSGQAVWALRFPNKRDFSDFTQQFRDCLFENTYGLEANERNRTKVLGSDFLGWATGEDGEGAVWEDAEDELDGAAGGGKGPSKVEEVHEETPAGKKPLGLALGALQNSYLLHSAGLDVFHNSDEGLHTEGLSLSFAKLGLAYVSEDVAGASSPASTCKALLMQREATLLLMTPQAAGRGAASAQPSPASAPAWRSHRLAQLDLGAQKVVAEWRFEKDGAPLRMLDVVGDSKGAQLDAAQATFLGLDSNQLCRWDMRAREGKVQTVASAKESPSVALTWSEGHQFARGTQFTCFATTGDGCVAVGDAKGQIRLYSTTSLRQAKTAFPGLGAPVTSIDVSFDGRWVLATTDKYLLVLCTAFRDKAGEERSAFKARAGDSIAAPRMLQLKPQHAQRAGGNFKFHEARFSWVTESGRQERSIVAAVKEFSVVWSFRRVKQQEHECYRQQSGMGFKTCSCYKVLPRSELVIDSQFMHDNYSAPTLPSAPLVVATPHEISSLRFSDA